MRPISRWAHLMSATVSVENRTGQDRYGQPTYGTASSYQAHLSGEQKLMRNAQGQQVVSTRSIYLNASVDIQPTARVTLSTADTGSTENYAIHPVIMAVERRFDQRGPHSVVVRLE